MNTARNLVATKSANPQWGPLLELAGREVFELMLGTPVSAPPEDTPTEIDITAMVGLAGQLCGVMSVRCKRETAAKMAGKMLGSEPLPDSQEVQDALRDRKHDRGEFQTQDYGSCRQLHAFGSHGHFRKRL